MSNPEHGRTPTDRSARRTLIAIASAIPDLVFVLAADGGIEDVLTPDEALLLAPAAELIGRRLQDFLPPDVAGPSLELIQRTLRTGEVGVLEYNLDVPAGQRWFEARTARVPGEGRVVCVSRDVTDRKRAELALARSNQELERLAYVASHDLREPLRMVEGFTRLLSERYQGRLDADADRFIAYAADGARRMQSMLDGLMRCARVQTQGAAPAPTPSGEVLDGALANLRLEIEEAGAQVRAGPLPTVPADPAQLLRLFQNLVSNALKFRGDDPPVVHVSARREGDQWRFEVRDNGVGVDAVERERVFELFRRGRHEAAGLGLGLAECERIVGRHGGVIGVAPAEGGGSIFHFTLPAGAL